MFTLWPEDIRLRRAAAMDSYRIKLDEEIRFYEFLQFLFAKQWKELKEYANGKGIRIIGDIPIYVAFDSADTWSHPELFEFDENGFPTVVAGVPPSCGAIRFTAGSITRPQVTTGGSKDLSMSSNSTTL